MRNMQCLTCKGVKRAEQFPSKTGPRGRTVNRTACLQCIEDAKSAETQRKADVLRTLDEERWWAENESKVLQWQKEYSLEFVVAKLKELGLQRQAAQLQATPHWADPKKIDAIYAEAARLTKETGIPHHVDHMVPIQGPVAKYGPFRGMRLVYGLHCEANLQILPGAENMSKGNRYWPDMPEEFLAMDKMLRKVA